MGQSLLPFNISLLVLSDQDVRTIRPVKVLDIFDGMSKNFHRDGLFSVETFGKVGEERRNRLFSYIDMRISVFHPVVYKALCDLKGLYEEIMAGKAYAVFDEVTKDFVRSDLSTGQTGYNFFVENFQKLQFEKRPSTKREFNIKLIEKYRKNCMLDKLVVMPAGIRDYTVDENNKPSEDEINGMYRKVLNICSFVEGIDVKANIEYLDSARFNLQLEIMKIYNYIKDLMEGKSKLVLGKWASRKVFNSTRNVITSYIPDTKELHSEKTVGTNQTVVGLYQYMRMILPLAVKHIRDTYLSDVFVGPNSPALLVNKKTLRRESVHLDPEYYDEWMTYEGLEKVMARFGEENLRHEPLEIEDYYIGLLYDDGVHYKFIQDIEDVPENLDKKHVRAITYAELLYLSVYKDSSEIPCFVTRYPITGYGSVYPSYVYLKTTVKSQKRIELGENWEPTGDIAFEFPIYKEQFYNSMSPSISHLGRLGADYDGDTMSATAVWTDESKAEVHKLLNSRNYYVGINGKMSFSADNDVISLVLASMTS